MYINLFNTITIHFIKYMHIFTIVETTVVFIALYRLAIRSSVTHIC